ncbi:MAG: hypothetical protein A2X48_17405 [Lentisphaerae bacterium GWF2_49_21]|nr:MAG: hypothetical protein A2X48_17405 [Lentisphaerae bacterium GWF2_49_21]
MNADCEYKIAAYYWPAYHDEKMWGQFFKGREGEWEIIRNSLPKFKGHWQPRIPLWGYENEADSSVMEKKIDIAADHGVNIFIFDWYWYGNKPFLEDCINKGFLKARNNDKIQFYLMWANHNACSLWDIERSHNNEIIWPGAVDRKTFDTIVGRVIERYMKHPSYYKIDGRPVFSIYEIGTLIKGLGGLEEARKALDSFRSRVIDAGFPGLHLQAILWKEIPAGLSMIPGDKTQTQDNTMRVLGFDSLTNYQWCHYVKPRGDYSEWAKKAILQWEPWRAEFSVPFYPHVSVGWDTNPRFKSLQEDVILNQSPQLFADSLRKAKEFLDKHSIEPRLLTINSWNEWSEGSYLEPDMKFGMEYLEAIRNVFVKPRRG